MTHAFDPARWPAVARAFDAALGLPAAERAAALDATCRTPDGAPDPALRAVVEELLAADAEAEVEARATGGLLAAAPLALHDVLDGLGVDLVEPPPTPPGTRVGPYRVVRPLGRGGMGDVYLAERADGLFERTVALKRVRADLGPALAARFEAERRILGGLVHPNIARLYAAGTDDAGRPWLAMEHVDGVPITDYAEARGLDARARVALMIQVCRAVAYAHQRLVIHRDLKPSNVLVTDGDAGPRVQLLDFGIAQILGDDADDQRLLTRAFAAPEQLRGEPATTATDVFGLGRLLAALVGPADADGLGGDLGAVARKALAEASADRYASAAALADDLGRWHEGLPVHALPATLGYRARRFVGRNRGGVAVASLALALVVAASTVAAVRVTTERDRAEQSAADAEAVAEAQTALLTVLNPAFRAERDSALSLADVAETAVAAAEQAYAGRPAVLGRQLATFAAALYERGRPDRADALYARALALRRPLGIRGDPVVHQALIGRGRVARDREDGDAARAFFADALALERSHPGLADPAGRTALYHASVLPTDPERERALRAALDARLARPGADTSLAVGLAHSELGAFYARKRQHRDAFPEFEAAERIVRGRWGERHPTTNELRANLAFASVGMGRPEEAERHARAALDAARRAGLGPLREATLRMALGHAFHHQYRSADAAAELRAAAALFEAAVGPDAPQTLRALSNLSVVETKRGENAAALAAVERVLAAERAAGRGDQLNALQMEARVAQLRFVLADRDEALADLLTLVERAPAPGVSDVHRIEILWLAGEALRASGRPAEALPLHREAVAVARTLVPETNLVLHSHRFSLGRTLAALGRIDEARPHLEFVYGSLDEYPAPDPLDDVDTEIDRLLAGG